VAEDDWINRIRLSVSLLSLSESPQELFTAFKNGGFVEAFLEKEGRKDKKEGVKHEEAKQPRRKAPTRKK